jgi:hypothetical protein
MKLIICEVCKGEKTDACSACDGKGYTLDMKPLPPDVSPSNWADLEKALGDLEKLIAELKTKKIGWPYGFWTPKPAPNVISKLVIPLTEGDEHIHVYSETEDTLDVKFEVEHHGLKLDGALSIRPKKGWFTAHKYGHVFEVTPK